MRGITTSASNINEASDFLDSLSPPYVLKADGLAAGKGVLIIDDINEAKQELQNIEQFQHFQELYISSLIVYFELISKQMRALFLPILKLIRSFL